MRTLITIIILLNSFFVLGQKRKNVLLPPPVLSMHYPEYMDFCEVLNHKDTLVYTRMIYRGQDEYWGLSTPDSFCTNKIYAYLNIPDSVKMNKKFLNYFKTVHENYWNTYLIIDAIGVFKNDKKPGYGHLGNNKSQFIVNSFVNIQKIIIKP
ncbi:hypothetical protein [Mucilaginibacter segetis]|uniref:Uncharacterized protein n=1 Tax=Mucilaginibacter segetis TaxID=2793071 RepID=A0A934UKY8_9SPHI|nr:hypothetical protein [Mucilaginibacter segetis]MBK0377799.1 hypothetical protein [Mucilaginibacter segetis]